MKWIVVIGIMLLALGACRNVNTQPEDELPLIPSYMPPVPYPADNPITREKAELGRRLFYEGRLSPDGNVSCSSCHQPDKAFSDAPRQISVGFDGLQGQRNSPMIVNAGYRKAMFWDGRAGTLEEQAMAAFLNPIEMAADTVSVGSLLRSAEYATLWRRAFGDTAVTMKRAMQAIATFERILVSADSRYDRFVRGDSTVLSPLEKKGMQLFFSDKTSCSGCHSGPDLTDDQFHNIGLFFHYFDRGRYVVTGNPLDEGKFKTPSLRNIALTPPYTATGDFEKGLLTTLEQVVDRYNDGGTNFHSKDIRVRKLNLTDEEKSALVAFLKTLTDSSVLKNPNFTKP